MSSHDREQRAETGQHMRVFLESPIDDASRVRCRHRAGTVFLPTGLIVKVQLMHVENRPIDADSR